MVTKKTLNKKLNVILARQNFLAKQLFCTLYTYDGAKKMEKEWNKIWYDIMGEDNG